MTLLHKPNSNKGLIQQYNSQMKKPTPKIYRTANWSSYNRALINRGNLTIWFDPETQWYSQPQGKHGRTTIQCCLMIKSLDAHTESVSHKVDAKLIESVFNSIPSQLSQASDESVKRFKFKSVHERKSRYSDFETAMSA